MHPLEQYRRNKKITAVDLAKAAGISRQTIWRIENGYTPSMKTAFRLAAITKIKLEALANA